LVEAIVADVGLTVPGSLKVDEALLDDVVKVPAGTGSPEQIAVLVVIGLIVLDDVQLTLIGVVPVSNMVPDENVPTELATEPENLAQATPPPIRVTQMINENP
jgi:hypothetical protein